MAVSCQPVSAMFLGTYHNLVGVGALHARIIPAICFASLVWRRKYGSRYCGLLMIPSDVLWLALSAQMSPSH